MINEQKWRSFRIFDLSFQLVACKQMSISAQFRCHLSPFHGPIGNFLLSSFSSHGQKGPTLLFFLTRTHTITCTLFISNPVVPPRRGVWLQVKFKMCHIGYRMRCGIGCSDTNKKNKLHNSSVIRETNLLSLINSSLAHVYCSITLSNHGLIRLNKFVSQSSLNLCI